MSEKSINLTSKVEHYKWKSKGAPGKLQYIKKELIQVNPKYQREVNHPKVLELARNWSWIGCGAISVAYREGKYWAMDGQHRVLGAMKRSDIAEIPCVVFETESLTEEAIGFLDLNTNRKPVSAISKHKALLVAEDELATFIHVQLNLNGLRFVDCAKSKGQIRCIAACKRIALQSKEGFSITLEFASELSFADDISISEILLDGLFYLHQNIGDGGLKNKNLIARLKKFGAKLLIRGAQSAAAFYSKGGAKVWAVGMLEVINAGLRNKFEMKP